MSSAVEAALRLDIAQYQLALAKARGDIKKLKSDAREGGSIAESLFGKGLAGMAGKVSSLAAAAGLGVLVKRGFEFNQAMNDSTIAIANVTKKFQGLSDAAARREAEKAMAQIVEMEPKTAATLQGLTEGFLATYAAAASAGVSIEQNVDLVGRLANAMANANIPAEQLTQELRSILTGNITSDSALAKMLQINNSDINKAKQAGNLYEFLVEQVGALGEAGDTAGVAFSTLNSAVDKAAGAFTEGLFNEAVGGAKALAEVLEQNVELFHDVGEGIASTIKFGAGFLGFMNNVRKATVQSTAKGVGGLMGLDVTNEAGFLDTFTELENTRTATKPEAPPLSETNGSGIKFSGRTEGPSAEAQAKSARTIEQTEKARVALAERQFDLMIEHMTPANAMVAIQQRIKSEIEAQNQALEQGPPTEMQMIENAERLMDLQDMLRGQRVRQSEATERQAEAAKEAADQAAREAEQAARKSTAADDLMLELQILREINAGHDRKAKVLQEQLEVERLKRQIVEQTGKSEEEALRIAQEMVKLRNAQTEGGRDRGERRKIQGYSREQQGDAEAARDRAEGRVADARDRVDADTKRAFPGLDEAPEFSGRRLKDEFKFPGLDAMAAKEAEAAGNAGAKTADKAATNPADAQAKQQPQAQPPQPDPVVAQIGQTVTQILTALSS